MGGALGHPGRTDPGLSAPAGRHGAARPGSRPGRRTVRGYEMTALTVAAQLDEDASLRPVPWRRMAWVTWRQHRVALIGVVVALVAIGAYTWMVGLQLHHAYAAELACHPAGSDACLQLTSGFNSPSGLLTNGWILQLLPALIGAFVGAPVLAREMETGTYRYAWTQVFGQWRWAL